MNGRRGGGGGGGEESDDYNRTELLKVKGFYVQLCHQSISDPSIHPSISRRRHHPSL